jgi:hypothetical protein
MAAKALVKNLQRHFLYCRTKINSSPFYVSRKEGEFSTRLAPSKHNDQETIPCRATPKRRRKISSTLLLFHNTQSFVKWRTESCVYNVVYFRTSGRTEFCFAALSTERERGEFAPAAIPLPWGLHRTARERARRTSKHLSTLLCGSIPKKGQVPLVWRRRGGGGGRAVAAAERPRERLEADHGPLIVAHRTHTEHLNNESKGALSVNSVELLSWWLPPVDWRGGECAVRERGLLLDLRAAAAAAFSGKPL